MAVQPDLLRDQGLVSPLRFLQRSVRVQMHRHSARNGDYSVKGTDWADLRGGVVMSGRSSATKGDIW